MLLVAREGARGGVRGRRGGVRERRGGVRDRRTGSWYRDGGGADGAFGQVEDGSDRRYADEPMAPLP